MNNVCITGRLTYDHGESYPRDQLKGYLRRVGVTVLRTVRSDCDVLVVPYEGYTSQKTRAAARLAKSGGSIVAVPWPQFAAYFQIGGFSHPPYQRWWRNRDGVLLCEVNDLFRTGETFRFEPCERSEDPLLAVAVGEPFRLAPTAYSPLAGRLVAEHAPV